MDEFLKELALTKSAEPSTMPSQMLGQDASDRALEGNVMRANGSGLVALQAVQMVVDELAVGVGVPKNSYVVEGRATLSKSFAVRFGRASLGHVASGAVVGRVARAPSGAWRQVQVCAPTGEDVPRCLSEDQSS